MELVHDVRRMLASLRDPEARSQIAEHFTESFIRDLLDAVIQVDPSVWRVNSFEYINPEFISYFLLFCTRHRRKRT